MGDTDDSIMDDSVVDISSPSVVEVIDLTSPSGSVRPSRSRQRNRESSSVTNNLNHHSRRPLSPIVLGNTQDTQLFVYTFLFLHKKWLKDLFYDQKCLFRKSPKKKRKTSHATNSNTVLTLDDTVKEDKTYYTVETDNKEPIPLKCRVCFELLTSNLKPITTRCGHLFCSECLKTFIGISKKCPTCKSTITLKSCTHIYL